MFQPCTNSLKTCKTDKTVFVSYFFLGGGGGGGYSQPCKYFDKGKKNLLQDIDGEIIQFLQNNYKSRVPY